MESILARALEYTLKYWLKSFSRDQFKLQGRAVQLSNLDINGDALHSSLGLPPALNVTSAKVGKLEIVLPSVSNVQVEPVVVHIDWLDLVLEENSDPDACPSTSCTQSNSSGGKGSGYGFADKIADGMTLEVHTVNLLLETRGGARCQGGSTWTPPMASITIRNLLLYTTNEVWEVVNLKEARDFSSNKQFIYVFKKLEWETLSIDLLPHPDMFLDARLSRAQEGANKRDVDGAKRIFFGGERFLEGISGQAYITVQRTELNEPLGLEVRFHITEAVCPAFSEPGLRALLRFLTGLYVCLNRGDVDPKSRQQSTEAAGCSMVSAIVDHIFFRIRDAEFQLEFLMQSLYFSRASVSGRENSNNLTEITIGGLFLRDTFSRPPCALIQPSMQVTTKDCHQIPDFAQGFCPPIYPLSDQQWQSNKGTPFISIYSLQTKPSPTPPLIASQTVIHCQPLMIHLQEESCLRMSSLLADGIVVSPGTVLPDFSIKSLKFTLKELDLTIPLRSRMLATSAESRCTSFKCSFVGARLHIENLYMFELPSLRLPLLDLDKDPACYCLWENQPVDAGQKKWTAGASHLSLSLETVDDLAGLQNSLDWPLRWRCVEVKDACIEVAMATPDGSPLTSVPPPGGVVRVGIACKQYLSNTSVEQLFFVLELYAYLGNVCEKIAIAGTSSRSSLTSNESWSDNLMSRVPADTAVRLVIRDLQLRFLEDSSKTIEGEPLVQFIGQDLCIKVSHRTLGGAIAFSSSIRWERIEVDCVDADRNIAHDDDIILTSSSNGSPATANEFPELRAVLWVQHKGREQPTRSVLDLPFLDVNVVHVIPLDVQDAECHSLRVSACISGVRLGGGMKYTESLLHRFGVLGPDGQPGDGLSRGLENLSAGPLSKIFKSSSLIGKGIKENGTSRHSKDNFFSHLGRPDDVDVSIDFRDWLFALEGAEQIEERFIDNPSFGREERCWHTTFKSLQVKAKNSPKHLKNGSMKSHGLQSYPVDAIVIGVEGLKTMKPQVQTGFPVVEFPVNGFKGKASEVSAGINVEVRLVIPEYSFHDEIGQWKVENLKLSVEQPIEAVVTKDELQHLAVLCKSELDSMGRIAAGILRLLKLEDSFGQAAIDQLSNLGSDGLNRIFTPKKLTNGSSDVVSPQAAPSLNGECNSPMVSMTGFLASLKEEVIDSRAKCDALISDLGKTESSTQHIDTVRLLAEKLASIESLLAQLQTQGKTKQPSPSPPYSPAHSISSILHSQLQAARPRRGRGAEDDDDEEPSVVSDIFLKMPRVSSSNVSANAKEESPVEPVKPLMVSKRKPKECSKLYAVAKEQCDPAQGKKLDEIDEIFSSKNEVKRVEKEKKKKRRNRSHKESELADHSSRPRKRTADGFVVYTEEELGINRCEGQIEEERFIDNPSFGREERCWHTTFKSLQVKAKNSPKHLKNGSMKSHGLQSYPVDAIVIGVEGLKTMKPQVQTGFPVVEFPVNGFKGKASEVSAGINVEVRLVIPEYNFHDEIGQWKVENLKLSVEQPMEAVVTKDELQHLAVLCKSELDSMGRIAAGILRLLKLEDSFGQAAIDLLSNLGSDGLNRILTPKKLTNGSSDVISPQAAPSLNGECNSPMVSMTGLVASLKEEVIDSRAKYDALISDLGKTESSTQHIDTARLLAEKLASIESLLAQLQT
ncbi:hypothetical protein Dimus_019100 [Dionaea muscipula]